MKQNPTDTARLLMGTGLAAICVATLVLALTHYATANAWPNATGSGTVVIEEVYGGAGCGTQDCSTYQRDYVVLFNRGTVAFSLSGRSVQYGSAGSTTVSSQTNLPAFTLNPGQYYLIAEGFGANGLSPLPIVPDVTGTIAMAATAGKVFLVGNTAALTLDGTGCPTSLATVIDFVGYGTSANCSEGGSPAPAPSTITSAIRRLRGCQDTDVNGTDFVASVPNPRNSGMTIPCSSPYPNPTGSPNPTPTGSPYPTLVRLVSADASRDDGMPFALGAVGVAALLGGGVWFLRQKRRK